MITLYTKKNAMISLLCYLIKLYKALISPLLPHACRFLPTCSDYTHESISYFGWKKGVYLGLKRVLKCNPLFQAGYDPIPKK